MSKRAQEAALKAHPICTHSGMIEKRRAERRRCHEEGYEQGERETIERIREQVKQWMPEKDGEEHTYGERLAFNSVLHLLEEMEEKQ